MPRTTKLAPASTRLKPKTSAARYFRLAWLMISCKRRSMATQATRSPRNANVPRCSRRSSSDAPFDRPRMWARSSRKRVPSMFEASCSGTDQT